jgi:glucokinase
VANQVLAGVDIGGTKTAIVLSLEPPRIAARSAFVTHPEKGPEFAIRRIVKSLHEVLSVQGLVAADVEAIGISCGGPLDPARGIIQNPPNLPRWSDIPICAILEAQFQIPCFLENDANAGALAEARFGAARGAANIVFLTMGTGLGAGLILDGKLHRGASQAAGEIGHVRLTKTGPVGHGKIGSIEGWASGGGMAQVAMRYAEAALKRGERTLLQNESGALPKVITAREVASAVQRGDPVAKAIVRRVGKSLGEGMAILIDVVNPEVIVVGGLALRFGDDLLEPARRTIAKEALKGSVKVCRIVPAALGEQIGDVAALCAAMEGLAHAKSKRRSVKARGTPLAAPSVTSNQLSLKPESVA